MKRIIFDFDGTLLDSRTRHTILLQNICRQREFAVPESCFSDYLPYKADGFSTFQYLTNRLGYEETAAREIAKQWVEQIENPEYLAMDTLYPDVKDVLKELCAYSQYELILLSARKREKLLLEQLQITGLDGYFSDIRCVVPSRADEEKRACMAEMVDSVLAVGDTEVDFFAAMFNNIPFYALNRGFRSANYWEKEGILSHEDLSGIMQYLQI